MDFQKPGVPKSHDVVGSRTDLESNVRVVPEPFVSVVSNVVEPFVPKPHPGPPPPSPPRLLNSGCGLGPVTPPIPPALPPFPASVSGNLQNPGGFKTTATAGPDESKGSDDVVSKVKAIVAMQIPAKGKPPRENETGGIAPQMSTKKCVESPRLQGKMNLEKTVLGRFGMKTPKKLNGITEPMKVKGIFGTVTLKMALF